MKTVLTIALSSLLFMISTGFKGCSVGGEPLLYYFLFAAFGTPLQNQDGFTEPYGITVGENGTIATTDGRPPAEWIMRSSGTSQNLNFVKVFDSEDSSVAFAVGNAGTVLRSSDLGHTWTNLSIPSPSRNLYGFDFTMSYPNQTVDIVVVGDSGVVMQSEIVGGNWTWTDISPPTSTHLTSIGIIGMNFYVVVGEKGRIYRTDDGGGSWHLVGVSDTSVTLERVFVSRFYPNFDRLWAVGNSGKIFASTNYGNSWFPQISGTAEDLHDVVFRDSNEGAVTGNRGTVRYTTNGGESWLSDPFLDGLTTRNIISASLVDSNTVHAVTVSGAADAISGSDTTFFLAVSSEPLGAVSQPLHAVPSSFMLAQNYPNPFNPATTLSFTIPYSSSVTLSVYDLPGREVATLVDEKLSPGRYERTFDARGLASGIYLYRLQVRPADGVHDRASSETRKLVLLR